MDGEKIDQLIKELPRLKGLVAKCRRCGKDMEIKIILVCPDEDCRRRSKRK
uniref:Uncharacterized protein n=1 Tax=viral metagenome TaxID=1070528 RepID=A0A6M3KUI2_9ZZZZ